MLEITRKTLTLEPQEVMEIERIITDEDQKEAFIFLKKKKFFLLSKKRERYLFLPVLTILNLPTFWKKSLSRLILWSVKKGKSLLL